MTKKTNLGYYWIAKFDDNSEIEQFDEDDNEILFKEVLDKMDELEVFSITDGNETYEVDLVKQEIKSPKESFKVTGSNPELIYFRRNQVRMEIGANRPLLPPRVVHHLGIKTNTQEQKFEVFAGQGVRPKKVEYNNVKTNKKIDKTEMLRVK